MRLPTAAAEHYNDQQRIAATATRKARALWRRLGGDFDDGWAAISGELAATVSGAMLEAAENGIEYVPAVLDQTGQATALATVSAAAFTGYTREGVAVTDALHGAVRHAKQAIGDGFTVSGALLKGRKSLERVIPSLIADADRGAVHVSITSGDVGGYVRMLNGPSCKDCIVLAGRWYRWNQGFQRHPRCDCRHIPASEDIAGSLTTDPYAAFHGMSEAEQDRLFGQKDAQAIRDGADIFRVVNTRSRGLPTAKARRGPRMTIDEIYETAGTRQRTIDMLTEQGYILPGGQQRDGLVGYGALGLNARDANALGGGTLGRGGTRKGATLAHRQAVATGRRDPTNRFTQTAAERRLGDAVTALQAAKDGRNPYGRGTVTRAAHDRAARELERELMKLRRGEQPSQVYDLAERLGVQYR